MKKILLISQLKKCDKIENKTIVEINTFKNYIGVWFDNGFYKRYTKDSTIKLNQLN